MAGPNGPSDLNLPIIGDLRISECDSEEELFECEYCFSTDGDCGCFDEEEQEDSEEEDDDSEEEEEEDSEEDDTSQSEYSICTCDDVEFEKAYDENYGEQMGCKRYIFTPNL